MTPHPALQEALCGTITSLGTAQWQGDFRFSPESLFFQGHFPATPVLPGVVQIMAACLVAVHGEPLILAKVKRCKFSRIVQPDELLHVEVALSVQSGLTIAKCTLTAGNEACAALTLELLAATVTL